MTRSWLTAALVLAASCTTFGDSEPLSSEELIWSHPTTGVLYLAQPIEPLYWDEAIDICLELTVAGIGTWRLPAAEEIDQIQGTSHPLGDGLPGRVLWEADRSWRQVQGFDKPGGALCVSGTSTAGDREICLNGADDDGDGQIDCADEDCFDVAGETAEGTCSAVSACVPSRNADGALEADPFSCRCASAAGCPFESRETGADFVCHTAFGACGSTCYTDTRCIEAFGADAYCHDPSDTCRPR